MEKFIRRVKRDGRSLSVTIPKFSAEAMGLAKGDFVYVGMAKTKIPNDLEVIPCPEEIRNLVPKNLIWQKREIR